MTDKVTRIHNKYSARTGDIKLEQTKRGTYEKWDRSRNDWSFGVFTGSEAFVIDAGFTRIYPSGRATRIIDSLAIPLDDKENLIAIRDLLNEAIEFEAEQVQS